MMQTENFSNQPLRSMKMNLQEGVKIAEDCNRTMAVDCVNLGNGAFCPDVI